MKIYIAHTLDEYELPIAVADSPKELAELVGTTKDVVSSGIYKSEKCGKRSRYKKVIVED